MTSQPAGARAALGEAVFIGRFRSRCQEKNRSLLFLRRPRIRSARSRPAGPRTAIAPAAPLDYISGSRIGRKSHGTGRHAFARRFAPASMQRVIMRQPPEVYPTTRGCWSSFGIEDGHYHEGQLSN